MVGVQGLKENVSRVPYRRVLSSTFDYSSIEIRYGAHLIMGTRSIAIPPTPAPLLLLLLHRPVFPFLSSLLFQEYFQETAGRTMEKFREEISSVREKPYPGGRRATFSRRSCSTAGLGCLSIPSHYSSRCSQCFAHDLGNRSARSSLAYFSAL